MNRRLTSIAITLLLMVSMLSGIALGANVTLTLSTSSTTVGTSVTASGTADANTWVSIKVLNSSKDIVVYDAVKADSNGNYRCTFKVPEVPAGTLDVIAGYGSNVNSQVLTVTSTPGNSGGGGGGGGGATAASGTTVSANYGGTVKEPGVSIVIPPNAISSDIKVKVEKILNTANLPVPAKSKIVGQVMEITKDKPGNFSKPVTITLTYDQSKVDTSKYDIGIYWLDTSSNKWVKLDNVQVDTAKGTVSGEVNHFGKFAVIATEKTAVTPSVVPSDLKLTDVAGHWAEANIKKLVASGAISGYPDGTFKPDNTITRAEFAAILVKAFKLESKTGKVFDDTAAHWARESIATAAACGIVNGYSDTRFGPNDNITREQMAVMIAKAAKLAQSTAGITFTDADQISGWAREAATRASAQDIISGYPDNTFRPKATATRAEAVTVIVKAL